MVLELLAAKVANKVVKEKKENTEKSFSDMNLMSMIKSEIEVDFAAIGIVSALMVYIAYETNKNDEFATRLSRLAAAFFFPGIYALQATTRSVVRGQMNVDPVDFP
jgi:hypothetical protein